MEEIRNKQTRGQLLFPGQFREGRVQLLNAPVPEIHRDKIVFPAVVHLQDCPCSEFGVSDRVAYGIIRRSLIYGSGGF